MVPHWETGVAAEIGAVVAVGEYFYSYSLFYPILFPFAQSVLTASAEVQPPVLIEHFEHRTIFSDVAALKKRAG